MARPIWKGAISFGLIHIPVGLYSAARANELDLDMLDRRDFSPIGFQRYNKGTGEPVDWENIVKGYEYEKGEYVVLSPEDFRRANVEATQTIDVHAFVPHAAVQPWYFETPYYLGPEKHGEKVYALLRDALRKSGRLAVASVVIRTRQHLAALMPIGDVILLDTLRYADEVLDVRKVLPDLKERRVNATAKELQLALRLIEEMSEDWQPGQYHDRYREDLMKTIEEKIRSGKTRTLTPPEEGRRAAAGRGKVVDLMALLKESLEERQRADGGAKRERASDTRAPARREPRRRPARSPARKEARRVRA